MLSSTRSQVTNWPNPAEAGQQTSIHRPPPAELSHKHFRDWTLFAGNTSRRSRAAPPTQTSTIDADANFNSRVHVVQLGRFVGESLSSRVGRGRSHSVIHRGPWADQNICSLTRRRAGSVPRQSIRTDSHGITHSVDVNRRSAFRRRSTRRRLNVGSLS